MSRLTSVVKRHPIVTFFVLSYALSWLAWPLWASGLYWNYNGLMDTVSL